MRTLLLLVLGAAVAFGASGAADVAARLQGEAAECRFLLNLCQQATDAQRRALLTPPSADMLSTRAALEANLRVQDAVDAARVIEQKHGGKAPACFQSPEYGFLAGALQAR